MRRLIGLVLGVGLLAATAGSVSAGKAGTATLWACNNALTSAVTLHVDWTGYHPDTLMAASFQPGSPDATTFPATRPVSWKFGTASWDTSLASWSSVNVNVGTGTTVAVDLYGHGKFIDETNTVDFDSLPSC